MEIYPQSLAYYICILKQSVSIKAGKFFDKYVKIRLIHLIRMIFLTAFKLVLYNMYIMDTNFSKFRLKILFAAIVLAFAVLFSFGVSGYNASAHPLANPDSLRSFANAWRT